MNNYGDWRNSELIKGAVTFFVIGIAWATMMFQLHEISSSLTRMDSRVAHMETYIIKQSHGDFQP